MKKRMLSVVMMFAVSATATAAYKVKVVFKETPKNDTVYLSFGAGKSNYLDSAVVKNGTVSFAVDVKASQFAFLRLKGQQYGGIGFFLEPSVVVETKDNSLAGATVKGGKENQLYNEWKTTWGGITADAGVIYRALDSATQRGKVAETPEFAKWKDDGFKKLEERTDAAVEKLVLQAPDAAVTAFVIEDRFVNYPNIPQANKFYGRLGKNAKTSPYGKSIAGFLAIQAKTAIGTKPDFSMPDADGKVIKLSDLKGKYILVDFWASWCGPCRKENPTVKKAYALYHEKGFEVLGASLDTKKDLWQKAVADDGLAWTQISDLEGWKSPVVEQFGIKGIPFNFLVDKEGKVIAKDLRGEALLETLAKLVK